MAYSKQFKEQAIALVADRGYDPARAARELGLPQSTLGQWLDMAGWRRSGLPAGHPNRWDS